MSANTNPPTTTATPDPAAGGPRLYTPAQVAARLGQGVAAVQNHIAAGRLRAVRLNASDSPRCVRVTADDLRAFVAALPAYEGQPGRRRRARGTGPNGRAVGGDS